MAPAQRYFASSSNSTDVANNAGDDNGEEDDFMSDRFLTAASNDDSKRTKTYSQMRKEAQKRSEEKGYIKSRAEREKEAREEGLKRNLLETPATSQNAQGASSSATSGTSNNNKALDMMMKMGFKPGQALGKRLFGDDAAGAGSASTSQSETDDNEDDGFIPLRTGIGAKRSAPIAESKPTKDTARPDDRRIDPIEIQMRQGRSGLGVEEAKRRRLNALVDNSGTKASLGVDDYRSRARDNHDERRALGKLVSARKTLKELDERAGVKDNYLWLDPHEEYARMRAELIGGDRFGPRSRLGDFGAVDEADEDNYGFGDDQNKDKMTKEGKIDINLEGEEIFEEDEIVQREEDKERFLAMDARQRLEKTIAHLRDKYRYCLWCGAQYNDKEEIEAECPGPDEDDH